MTKRYDRPTTPHHRANRHDHILDEDKTIMAAGYDELNPVAAQRRIQALTGQLLTLTTRKAAARRTPPLQPAAPRASQDASSDHRYARILT